MEEIRTIELISNSMSKINMNINVGKKEGKEYTERQI